MAAGAPHFQDEDTPCRWQVNSWGVTVLTARWAWLPSRELTQLSQSSSLAPLGKPRQGKVSNFQRTQSSWAWGGHCDSRVFAHNLRSKLVRSGE